LAGLLEFCIHVLNIPITAHSRRPNHDLDGSTSRSALCFISLIKSLNLAGAFASHILNIPITADHQHHNLKFKSFKRPFAMRNSSRLVLLVSRPLIIVSATR
jgi:hypothetical protein